ncbi:TPA: cysteine--tRNA ligase [Candidatus Taylorbacteria bacterium]|nr:cysteine--tRNA ligase [Candidatus Taylorbacteria bacterium]
MLQFHNTLTGKKEEFKPIKPGLVGMYHCGPTVYNYPHIGNLRPYVFADILRRGCELAGLKVTQVINITDFGHLTDDADAGEDKMTSALKREGKALTLEAMRELADKYTKYYVENIQQMNIRLPDVMPLASEHIKEDVELIKVLDEKGFIYQTSDGLYFDTSKDPDYGKLSPKMVTAQEAESSKSRIGANPEKKNQRDFAVWKFNNAIGFQSKWGQGFPGWHIECSAMSMRYLGETFDIHTGGIDHIPVHHNNEIAQAESATGKPLAHYWLHVAHVIINSEKMSKSLGNFLTLQNLIDQGIEPLTYRYWLLGAHYSTQMNLTIDSLKAAQTGYKKLLKFFSEITEGNEATKLDENFLNKFKEYIFDDLDTPKAIALLWDMTRDNNIDNATKKAMALEFDKVLGLGLGSIVKTELSEIPQNILNLVSQREIARKNKDWKTSDKIRDEISKLGYQLTDTEQGPVVLK